jgi:hypothetical protein
MRTLILNSNNIVPNTNNAVLEYNFPAGSVTLEDTYLALQSLTMYYSTFNITYANNNNFVQYVWIDGLTYNVTFPDGFYDATGIQNYIRSVMLTNGHYLLDLAGEYVWFFGLTTNPSTYSIQMNFFACNTTAYPPATYALPAGATWTVPVLANSVCPQIIIPATNNFGLLIGFNAGTYPASNVTAVNVSALSNFAPQITPLSSYILSCSLVNNNYAVPNTFLYAFPPQGTIGDQFTIAPYSFSFIPILKGQYSTFRVQLTDQANRPIVIQDPNYTITLVMADGPEVRSK